MEERERKEKEKEKRRRKKAVPSRYTRAAAIFMSECIAQQHTRVSEVPLPSRCLSLSSKPVQDALDSGIHTIPADDLKATIMAARNHAKLNVNAERALGAMHCIRRMLHSNNRGKRGMNVICIYTFTVASCLCNSPQALALRTCGWLLLPLYRRKRKWRRSDNRLVYVAKI